MTVTAPRAATLNTLGAFVDEALTGPVNGGRYATVREGGVEVELSASRGWGVQLARVVAGGTVSRHLPCEDLTVETVVAAYQDLLGAS